MEINREEITKLLEVYSLEELIERDYDDIVEFVISVYEAGLLTQPEVTPL